MDVLTPEQRRRNMAAIRNANTKPEMVVRRTLHRRGYRYVLRGRNLPGRPDLVFPGRHKVIFVHGCYWHMHECRYGCVTPRTNAAFWRAKREGNVARDRRTLQALRDLGWDVLIVWECETKDAARLEARLIDYMKAVGLPRSADVGLPRD
jgi:DNA mismatch endonuclease (patch repair protein)